MEQTVPLFSFSFLLEGNRKVTFVWNKSPAVFFFISLRRQQEGYNDYVTPELAPCVRKYHFYYVLQYLFAFCGFGSTPCGLTIVTIIIQ